MTATATVVSAAAPTNLTMVTAAEVATHVVEAALNPPPNHTVAVPPSSPAIAMAKRAWQLQIIREILSWCVCGL